MRVPRISQPEAGHALLDRRPSVEDLQEVYLRSWPSLLSLLWQERELSNPVLMSPPPTWWARRRRVLIVGQQTGPTRWQSDYEVRRKRPHRVSVAELMRRYSLFNRRLSGRSSHFWRFVHELERRLGLEAGAATWVNLNRCDHRGARPIGLEEALWTAFPVVGDELRLLRPTTVVFLTGPTYDGLLKRCLAASVEPVEGFSLKFLARVVSPQLPRACFRTYHPNFLCRFRAPELPRILDHLAR